jgi:phosphatidate cytidylyltransferase
MAKPETKKTGSLLKRTLAALVMLPIVIGALRLGYPYVDALLLIVGALLSWEWSSMASKKNPSAFQAAYIVSLAVSALTYDPMVILMCIVLTSLFVWLKSKHEDHRLLLTLGVPYISIGLGSLIWIYHDIFMGYPYDFYFTLWFCMMVWAMDIGGYLFGSTIKGPKLAPRISPNKTWAGLIGGILLAVSTSFLYFYLISFVSVIHLDSRSQLIFAVVGGIVALVSQIGDLIESAIKRHLGLKDSSHLIPGHGGVFDRIDGLIFAAPFFYWVVAYGLLLF